MMAWTFPHQALHGRSLAASLPLVPASTRRAFPGLGELLDGASGLLRRDDLFQETPVELPDSRRSLIVSWTLCPVMMVSALLLMPLCAFVRVSPISTPLPPLLASSKRQPFLPGEDVAGVHDAQRREEHPGVAVRVAAPEVVQVDLIGAAADRHPILERPLRHAAALVLVEDARHWLLGRAAPTRQLLQFAAVLS